MVLHRHQHELSQWTFPSPAKSQREFLRRSCGPGKNGAGFDRSENAGTVCGEIAVGDSITALTGQGSLSFWTAAGSEAPRSFSRLTKAVSSLRSATAVQTVERTVPTLI